MEFENKPPLVWPSRTPGTIYIFLSHQNMVSVPQVEYSIHPTLAILNLVEV